jgi:hypothetical protein
MRNELERVVTFLISKYIKQLHRVLFRSFI